MQSLSGPLTLDLRLPGQWFQLEAGLHYNWHRHYDASLGRYTQADPLGFVDGPSVFGYARSSPYRYVDPSGNMAALCAIPGVCPTIVKTVIEACTIAWILSEKSKTCTVTCNVQQIDPGVVCPDRVTGEASGKGKLATCQAAQSDANSKVPRGCYKRHCDWDWPE